MIKCSKCGFENQDGDKFCAQCGAQLTSEKYVVTNEAEQKKKDEEFNRLKEERAKVLRENIRLKEEKEKIPVSPGVISSPGGTTQPAGNGSTGTTTGGTHTSTGGTHTGTGSTGTRSAQPSKPWYKQWYVWLCVLAVAAGIYMFMPSGSTESEPQSAEQILSSATEAISHMEGNYTLRETNGGTLVNGIRTAAIKKSSETQARILVTSEYGPDFYDFTFTTDGKIQSEKLGTGEINYNERLDKITITFKQGERICEFTK